MAVGCLGWPPPMSDDATYPMRLAARLSGLTPATIRAWERRYAAVVPDRTAGGARRYSPADVRRLVLLRQLTERGHGIAEIASLSGERLQEMLGAPVAEATKGAADVGGAEEQPRQAPLLSEYFAAVDVYDVRSATEVLSRAAALLPPRKLVYALLLPLVRQVGERWATGELGIAQEHLISAQMRWLLSLVLRLAMPEGAPSRVLVATPPGERHELGALVAAILAAASGLEPVYVAPDLPWSDLLHAVDRSDASLVVLSLVRDLEPRELRSLSEGVAQLASVAEIWIGLPSPHPATTLDLPARLFHDFPSYDTALRARHAQR